MLSLLSIIVLNSYSLAYHCFRKLLQTLVLYY